MDEDEIVIIDDGEPTETGDEDPTLPADEEPVPDVDDDADRPDEDWDETGVEDDADAQQTFTSQPVPPYRAGDIWENSGDTYICINGKDTGESFAESDWVPAEAVVPTPTTTTRTVTYTEVIDDFSAASLASYQARGAVAYALYDDGTRAQVQWSQVQEPTLAIPVVVADEALAVAQATNQHFWSRATDPDQDGAGTGAFVTDDEQDDFLAAAAQGFPDLATKPWHNILMNSLGILLRTGLNNLVSMTRSAVAFFDGSGNQSANVVASFGSNGAQIGKDGSMHAVIDSRGLSVFDSERSAAHFGVNGSRIYGPDAVPLFDIDTDGSVKVADVVIGAPPADGGSLYEDVTFSETISVPSFENGTSVSLQPVGRVLIEDDLLIRFSTNSSTRTYDASDATISDGGVTLSFSNQSSSRIKASGITLTAGTPMTAYGAVNGIKYRETALGSLCTIDYRFDVSYDGNSSITFTHTIGVERFPLLNPSELTYQAWYMSTAGTVQMRSPSYSIGTRFGDSGDYSAIIGEGLIASSDNQTALGRYNVKDASGYYPLIIGNGTDDANRSDALVVDWSGNVECGTVNGVDVTAIGAAATPVSETTSVASGTNVNVASIQLAAGTWMVCAKCQFPSNATGRRAVKLSTTSQESGNVVSTNVQTAVSGATMQMSTSRCFTLASAGTVYLVAWQNSGGALSCVGDIEATRIC